ncbi:MAG: pilus assembly protein N-terminal domain-containing protein [Gemmatimonadales bacterium]|nr:MAG: pilus assembly protein N-terminal domain-containing protein [Gemmatimonadales bacterium]
MHPQTSPRIHGFLLTLGAVVGALLALLALPSTLVGQMDIQTRAEEVITISRGSTAILTEADSITRISIADPSVAEPVVIPPNQVLINARTPGSTSLVIWGWDRVARMYTVEVTADVASLQRQIDDLFPDAGLTVTSTGSSIVLSGQVRDAQTVRKATELAETMGIPIVNNIQAPSPEQILLHVEFAEVSKSALKEMGRDLIRLRNPHNYADWTLDEDSPNATDYEISSVSEGIVTLMVEGANAELDMVLRALRGNGDFKSLAQPNLVTREGQPATFLAGGEFPFPSIQGGTGGGPGNAVTVQWKEFGIRLNFLPTITNTGAIRLQVSPEVSSLDFANGLTLQGFSIPSVLARRVETDVELRPGQTLAIGGLMDNTIAADMNKHPILGSIPILGYFFRSEAVRQNRTELLVLVTPYILDPNALPAPPLPTGPAEEWNWDSHIGNWIEEHSTRERLGDPPAGYTSSGNGGGAGR